jgi:hypothetical protein
MAKFLEKDWNKKDLLSFIGEPGQIGGVQVSKLCGGRADGVKQFDIRTGSGLEFKVLPDRCLDIPQAFFKGIPLAFNSGTGITAGSYYEEPRLGWLRGFNVGLLSTCGITNAGAPSIDEGNEFGLHGRIANSPAEDVSVKQEWVGDDYIIEVSGSMRESMAMFENMRMNRTISTKLGAKSFKIHDHIENNSFTAEPLMMLYHYNIGWPVLSPESKMILPFKNSVERGSDEAPTYEDVNSFPPPEIGTDERVFFHIPRADSKGNTFVAVSNILNDKTIGIRMNYNINQLPQMGQWIMNRAGFYVMGLEPSTVKPIGRGVLRKQDNLPMIDGMESYDIDLEIILSDDSDEISEWTKEAEGLKSQ